MANKKDAADKVAKKEAKKKLTALEVEALQHSAADHVRPDSFSDISGSSEIINTGPVVSYRRRR